jgi:hypothetical protein
MPCPNEVDIPRNFDVYNQLAMYDDDEWAEWAYNDIPKEKRANACVACLECEDKCPQSIPISDWMVHVHEVLAQEAPLVCELP